MKYRVTVVVWDKLSIQGTTIPALNREFVQNHHGHLVCVTPNIRVLLVAFPAVELSTTFLSESSVSPLPPPSDRMLWA